MTQESQAVHWIDWPSQGVSAAFTTRSGGVSQGVYRALNLATHVGDYPEYVNENRAVLKRMLTLPAPPVWMQQEHGNTVVKVAQDSESPVADAVWTDRKNVVLAVLTADCLPVLMSTKVSDRVAAVHCGWRSLAAGILTRTVEAGGFQGGYAWLGPCIRAENYIVGGDVVQKFQDLDERLSKACRSAAGEKWHLDLAQIARMILEDFKVNVMDCGLDTYGRKEFYSYRRDGVTGRQACLIWMQD